MKTLVLILLFINISFGSIIKNVYILEDNPSINFKNIKTNENFKKTTTHIQRETQKEYWIKIDIDNSKLEKNKNYLLKVHSRFDTNTIEFDKSLKQSFLDKKAIELDPKNLKHIYLKVLNDENYIDIIFQIYTKKELFDENLFKKVMFGVAYGILFSASLYYLAFYIFNRQKSFIYYSLTQASMLLLLLNVAEDIFILFFMIFSILFTKEFLNTKKYTPKIDKVLTFMIYFYLIDTIIIEELLSKNFPTSIFLLFYIFASIIIYNKTKQKPILFYIIGWSIVVFAFMFIEFQFIFIELLKTEIPLDIFAHFVTPVESLILAFSLSYKMKLLEQEKLKAERMMVHQNKLAAMGEMISNIAHQWRQPLTHLSYILMNINTAFKHQKLDEKYLGKKTNEATGQLEYMSNTIDDFRNFYMPKIDKENFSAKEAIKNSLTIISSTLEANKINLKIVGDDFSIDGYKSEFSQVILNLISNAKDALVKNEIKNPTINIIIKKDHIYICDNAGGIDDKLKEKIFEPYFTTKQKGSGLGLYMSKTIIETHFNGTLSHQNKNDGSCFRIILN